VDFLDNEGSALFQEHSSINHSCFPNAASVFDGNHVLRLVAIRMIEPGDEINTSYIAPCELDHSRHTRQKYLQYVCHVIILTLLFNDFLFVFIQRKLCIYLSVYQMRGTN